MLDQSHKRWANVNATLFQCVLFAGYLLMQIVCKLIKLVKFPLFVIQSFSLYFISVPGSLEQTVLDSLPVHNLAILDYF